MNGVKAALGCVLLGVVFTVGVYMIWLVMSGAF